MATSETVKTRLKHLISNADHVSLIQNAVTTVHQVVSLAYELIKLTVLEEHDAAAAAGNFEAFNNLLDGEFINHCIHVVCHDRHQKKQGRPYSSAVKLRIERLFDVYDRYTALGAFPKTKPVVDNLSHSLIYAADAMRTAYENNVKMRFPNYIKRYLNTLLMPTLGNNPTAAAKKALFARVAQQTSRLMMGNAADAGFTHLVTHLFPPRPPDAAADWNRFYDLACRPGLYLHHMVWINRQLETLEAKLFSPLCLFVTFFAHRKKVAISPPWGG